MKKKQKKQQKKRHNFSFSRIFLDIFCFFKLCISSQEKMKTLSLLAGCFFLKMELLMYLVFTIIFLLQLNIK